jgi:lipopolysaccharide/colanic/teichoic acid biosynthesis glycosyltransferase
MLSRACQLRLKRMFDVSAAAGGLVALSPVLAVAAAGTWWHLGSPVLFTQERPGLDGRVFRMVKFRTMSDARGADGRLLPDAERLGPWGRWLRSTSIDELPELWNVLVGDMSVVGPRPLRVHYLPLYNRHQARRHEMRPGITGWAQVNGRNALSWEARFDHDVWYVDHFSLALDLRILLRTVAAVWKREGISAEGAATMTPFTGTPEPA